MKIQSQRNNGAAAPGGPLGEDEGVVPIVRVASAARSDAAIPRQLWQRPGPSHRAWARGSGKPRPAEHTGLRSVASLGGLRSAGTSLRFNQRCKGRHKQSDMKDNENQDGDSEKENAGTADNQDPTANDGGLIIPKKEPIGRWIHPALIARNHFKHKSLSCWSFNPAVGCSHGCEFCYVPSVSTNKLGPQLAKYGVSNPDAEWGSYALLRPWDEHGFLKSLAAAERTPLEELNPDGNRAVLFSSTTDPYQVFPHPDPAVRKQLMEESETIIRRALRLILEHSTLNVRILTRSPLARRDFDLYREFGDRLLFGMSLPTLDNRLAKVYEPGAPSPSQRLKTLQAAKEAGLHVYVAVAPTYPECSTPDFVKTLAALKPLDPVTIFHEPINIRAENVKRIELHAAELGVELKTDVFATRSAWRWYANTALWGMEVAAYELGLEHRLHLWPDSSLGSKEALREACGGDPEAELAWLQSWWNRVSEWPGRK